MGIVANGQLYRGVDGGAGEVGHTQIDKRGTLEELASDPAILRYVTDALKSGETSKLGPHDLTLDCVVEAAKSGDGLAVRALAEAGHWFGVGIANLINVLNPGLVIVGGEGVQAGPLRLDAMYAAIDRYTYVGLGKAKVVIEFGGNQTWARGAASLVLDKVFQTPVPGALVL
jgi:glucokinase